MQEPENKIAVEESRMQRVINAVALASAGEIELALKHLDGVEQDSFGVVEEALRVFLSELSEAMLQSSQALTALAASKRELESQLDTIQRQERAIRELSVPIIDIWHGILTLPLVGLFDSMRAVEVTERLLARVADDSDVEWVILDLTGVTVVDTMTAQHLVKLAQAVQLLGARCILTGLGGHVAGTLVTIGVSLDELSPMRSLREGLRFCLAQRKTYDLTEVIRRSAERMDASRETDS
ncbi:STAS domain-containing protein [Sorangium sp. So ce1335]|uniref:STAS domain-containing protein n=1 Tax=Sorangium sp. So ce1335 TaxID=3133335 RepID=UPI003F61484D